MNTHYGNQHYSPDPLPVQRPIHNQETISEFAAIRPITEPLAHSGIKPPHEDNLLSPPQRAIEKCAEEILTILSHSCRCDHCKNGVKVLLSDLLADVMTETTIVTLSVGRLQRSFDHLHEDIKRLLEGKR